MIRKEGREGQDRRKELALATKKNEREESASNRGDNSDRGEIVKEPTNGFFGLF